MTEEKTDRERIDEGRSLAEMTIRALLGHGRDFADMAGVTFCLAHRSARAMHAALLARGGADAGGGWLVNCSDREALVVIGMDPPSGDIPVLISAGKLNALIGLPPDLFASGTRGTA
jgi:hypothetical protein